LARRADETATVVQGLDAARAEPPTAGAGASLPRRDAAGPQLAERLVILLALLAGVALPWII
jgi:hypothetical protein